MNTVFIVPTGIGAEIGGHAGDATPAAKLIANVSDKMFTHPNVVNASDINEMTDNMFYVEGSILDGFLAGDYGLEEVYSNKILLITNEPVKTEVINAVSGARATLGADITLLQLETPLLMTANIVNGLADGKIENMDEVIRQVKKHDFDVLVINTPIIYDMDEAIEYLREDGGVNLWGGVEAKLSKLMSEQLNRPVIHAPVENQELTRKFNEVVDPRKAAEMVSVCFLHCCLKGGHVAPRISQKDNVYWNKDIDFLVSPIRVWGRPHRACQRLGIPIIVVEENSTVLNDKMATDVIIAKNYLEAAGIISAKKAGVTLESVRRPLKRTKINN